MRHHTLRSPFRRAGILAYAASTVASCGSLLTVHMLGLLAVVGGTLHGKRNANDRESIAHTTAPRWTLPAGPLPVLVPPAALSSSCVVLSRSAQAKATVQGGRLARVPVPVGPALAAAAVFSALRCWAIRVKRV